MPNARPRPPLLFQRRQVSRIAIAAAAAAFASGYIASEVIRDADLLSWLASAAAEVAAMTLFVVIMEVRLARQLTRAHDDAQQHRAAIERRLDSRLHKAEFAEGYVRGLQRRPPDDGGDGPHLRAV